MIKLDAAPVILIYFAKPAGSKNDFGVPMPIYLSEKLTGLYVDTERKHLSISTDYTVSVEKDGKGNKKRGNLVVQQKGESQETTVNLLCRRDSIGLNMILPALQSIYDKVVATKDYRIAYFNKNILIFNSRLSSLEVNQKRTDNLVEISFGLTVSPETEEEKNKTSVLAKSWDGVLV